MCARAREGASSPLGSGADSPPPCNGEAREGLYGGGARCVAARGRLPGGRRRPHCAREPSCLAQLPMTTPGRHCTPTTTTVAHAVRARVWPKISPRLMPSPSCYRKLSHYCLPRPGRTRDSSNTCRRRHSLSGPCRADSTHLEPCVYACKGRRQAMLRQCRRSCDMQGDIWSTDQHRSTAREFVPDLCRSVLTKGLKCDTVDTKHGFT